jgi:hypothetical protein
MGCKSKISEEKRNELTLRMHKIGLHGFIGSPCLCEEQQDIMLEIQNNIAPYRADFLHLQSIESSHPSDNYIGAKKHLKALIRYFQKGHTLYSGDYYGDYRDWGEVKNLELLHQIKLRQPIVRATEASDRFISYASNKMTDEFFSQTKRKELLKWLMLCFEDYEFTENEKLAFDIA